MKRHLSELWITGDISSDDWKRQLDEKLSREREEMERARRREEEERNRPLREANERKKRQENAECQRKLEAHKSRFKCHVRGCTQTSLGPAQVIIGQKEVTFYTTRGGGMGTPGEIRRIAGFLDIPLTDTVIAEIVPDVSLEALRRMAESHGAYTGMKGGPQTFFFKGSNGRWKEHLSAEELALYEQTAAKVLTPDCRLWLEQGRAALTMMSTMDNFEL